MTATHNWDVCRLNKDGQKSSDRRFALLCCNVTATPVDVLLLIDFIWTSQMHEHRRSALITCFCCRLFSIQLIFNSRPEAALLKTQV